MVGLHQEQPGIEKSSYKSTCATNKVGQSNATPNHVHHRFSSIRGSQLHPDSVQTNDSSESRP